MNIKQIIKEELTKVLEEEERGADRLASERFTQNRNKQRANAGVANEIEDLISDRLISVAGPVGHWTPEHLETFEQINNLLNVLFPSGK